ncbi:uncharacterized protein [Linepithema humile]|uniref:uncharacterized protein isoform X2 n=1 Tax=Linepithema humile TaxID=83485 RepID=UPI00351F1812
MFAQRPYYFSQLSRSYPILKLVDIYDRQSFIRAYVLDNVYICILMYILFYVTLWYASNIIKRIEKSNREMLTTVAENKTKLDRLVLLKNKKTQFEEVIVKTADAQKITTKQLEDEMYKLSTELITTSSKISKLEKVVEKYEQPDKFIYSTDVIAASEGEHSKRLEGVTKSLEKCKILEPSFPPIMPPEPPPRKYGIFVSRPPGQRRAVSADAPAAPPPKVRFK